MHVVYLNPSATVGGAERVLLAMMRTAPELIPGFTATLLLPEDGPLVEAAGKLGVPTIVVPWPTAFAQFGDTQLRNVGRFVKLLRLASTGLLAAPGMVRYARAMKSTLAKLQPSLVHSNGLKTHFAAALARPVGTPVVWHVHDFYTDRPIVGKMLRPLRKRVSMALAVSDALKRDTEAVLPGVRIETLRNAVDVEHFTPGEVDGANLDRLADLPPSADIVRIGLVATYANWKGQGVFLEALAQVLPKFPQARGYIIGGPIYKTAGSQWTKAELEAKAQALGLIDRVGFVPFQADPCDVYRMLDIVVHASTRPEPLGLTIAEAMSCGRAVVASAAGGAVELFTEGETALGHEPGNIPQLAACLDRLLSDPHLRRTLGTQARRHAVTFLGLAAYGKKLAALYGTLTA